jgi:hypothetical protein
MKIKIPEVNAEYIIMPNHGHLILELKDQRKITDDFGLMTNLPMAGNQIWMMVHAMGLGHAMACPNMQPVMPPWGSLINEKQP